MTHAPAFLLGIPGGYRHTLNLFCILFKNPMNLYRGVDVSKPDHQSGFRFLGEGGTSNGSETESTTTDAQDSETLGSMHSVSKLDH
jgi:hypothetical protein